MKLFSSQCAWDESALADLSRQGEYWTVEIALPLASLAERTGRVLWGPFMQSGSLFNAESKGIRELLLKGARTPPLAGDFWRASFSRVQWGLKA